MGLFFGSRKFRLDSYCLICSNSPSDISVIETILFRLIKGVESLYRQPTIGVYLYFVFHRFVSDLCMLNYDQSDVSTYPLTKLHGIALLAYLMSKTDGCMSHGCEPIVRLLFKEAARPFIK